MTVRRAPTRSGCSPRSLAPFAAVALATLAACAGGQKAGKLPVWPAEPATARIKYVRTFASEEHLGAGGLRAFGRALVAKAAVGIVQPTGLAFSPDEKVLYVASPSAPRVIAVDREARSMRWAREGDAGRVDGPFGVATDDAGNLYVTEHAKDDVVVFQKDGGVRRFGKEHLERPSGIAIDRRRQLVYVTAGSASASQNHRVEVFSQKGDHLRTIGTRGHQPGEFNFPVNLAIGPDGSLYVVDMLNFRVQVFDPDGQLVGMFGALGVGAPGLFDKAKGVALDAFGNIYVSDSSIAFVQIFNAKYQPLMAFSSRGERPGDMWVPTAIAIDSKNTIFVADFAMSAVHEFQLVNTTAADSFDDPARKKDEKKAAPAAPSQKP